MTLPIENLDDKTFEELVKEAVSRIPIYTPEGTDYKWTDHNIHDPGITLIELFAWLAEMQIYRLNRITDRSYRKFLKLMGILKLKPARAAEVDVTFSPCNQNPTSVPKGTKVAASDPISGEDIIFETEDELNVVDAKLKQILSPYLFSWDNVPGTDNEKLLSFLKYGDPKIDWVENAEITKSDDGKTVHISKEKNSAEITINVMEKKATLISNGKTYDLKVKKKNGKLNIYSGFIDHSKANENEHVYYYAFGYEPEKGDLYLGFDKNLVGEEITLAFSLYEEDLPKPGRYAREKTDIYPSAILSWEYYTTGDWKDDTNWKSVVVVNDETRHLTVSGKIRIKIERKMGQTVINKAMFSISDGELDEKLNEGRIPEKLKMIFKDKGFPLSEKTSITKENGGKWAITDEGEKNTYIVKKEDKRLYIYAKLFWIRCMVDKAGYEIPPRINMIRLNTVSAIQCRLEQCTISSNGLPDFYFNLKYTPVIDKTLKVEEEYLFNWDNVPGNDSKGLLRYLGDGHDIVWAESAEIHKSDDSKTIRIFKDENSAEIMIDVKEEKATLKISGGRTHDLKVKKSKGKLNIYKEEEWNEVEDFDASKPGDRHYTVDLATGRVSFGDGIHGKIPPKGEDNIIVSYHSGGGVRGNVGPHAIDKVLSKLAVEVTVDNVNAASGGEEAETLEEAIQCARKDMKTVYRAVTLEDYEHLARNTPGLRVARAKAISRYHPSQNSEVPGIVTVVIVPYSPLAKPEPSAGFLKTVYGHLDKHHLLTTELFVIPPEYVEVSVEATVVIKPKSHPSRVKGDVEKELRKFLNPITGGVDKKGWPFGRSVYRSEIYKIIDGVEGVDYVTSLKLKRKGKDKPGDILISPPSLVFHSIDFPTNITIEKGASHE